MQATQRRALVSEKSAMQFQFIAPPVVLVGPDGASSRRGLFVALVAVMMGFTFGFALFKGHVFDAQVIRHQFVFTDNTMLKVRQCERAEW